MSFFATTTNINHKPHIRQKGFAPDDLYNSSNATFHGKYPTPPLNLPSMDFGDDLAGLMASDGNGGRSSPQYQQQQHIHQDDHYRHNIFDTQSPHHSLSLSLDGSSSHHSYHSSHSYSHSLSIPKSPPEFASSPSSSSNTTSNGLTSPLLTTLPLQNGNVTSRARSHSHSVTHGQQQQQHHGHHGHTPHSLSHSGTLNGNLNPMGSLGIGGGYGMNGIGMNSLGGSMGMMGMGNMGVANGGLSLGPVQSPTHQSPALSSNNVDSSLSTSHPSPPGQLLTSSSTSTTTTTNYQDKQSLLANEKRRRRRESHNAVERRRRDNINEKISELATLIPECMLEGGGPGMNTNTNRGSSSPTSPPSSYSLPNGSNSPGSGIKEESNGAVDGENGVVKANKGMILRKSVDYIRYLQQLVTAQGARNRELEQELKAYRRSMDSSCSPKLNGYPTGRSEGDDENYDHSQHHHQHQQHPQHHQYHNQQEEMVVDNLGMGLNMELMGGMNTMNHLDSDGDNSTGAGGALKEEDDDGIVDGGFGRSTRGM